MKLHTFVLLAAAVAAPSVFAQAPPAPSPEVAAARAAVQKACANDMNTTCAGKQGREAFQCLRENTDKVSPDCKDALSKLPQRPPGGAPPPPAQ